MQRLKNFRHAATLALLTTVLCACSSSDNGSDNTGNNSGGGASSGGNSSGGSGSGGSGNSGNQNGSSYRLAAQRFDFDNNGIDEGVSLSSYNGAGQLTGTSYSYTNDGTTDADFESFSIATSTQGDSLNEESLFDYDSSGRLILWSIDNSDTRTEITYSWRSDNQVNDATFEGFDNTGALSYSLLHQLSYNAGQLDGFESTLSGQSSPILSLTTAYNSAGQLVSDLLTYQSGLQEQRTFSWRADGKIDFIDTINPDPGSNYQATTDFIYDANNRLIERLHVLPDQIYSWHYDYDSTGLPSVMWIDLGNDGSYDAKVSYEWETGPCQIPVMWAPRAEPSFPPRSDYAFSLGDGHAPVPSCASAL